MTIKEVKKYISEVKEIIDISEDKTTISAIPVNFDPHLPRKFAIETKIGDYHIIIRKMFREGKENEKMV